MFALWPRSSETCVPLVRVHDGDSSSGLFTRKYTVDGTEKWAALDWMHRAEYSSSPHWGWLHLLLPVENHKEIYCCVFTRSAHVWNSVEREKNVPVLIYDAVLVINMALLSHLDAVDWYLGCSAYGLGNSSCDSDDSHKGNSICTQSRTFIVYAKAN